MGWSTQVVYAAIVIIEGPTAGLFIYNGTPADGNPPVLSAVAPGVTADPYGNPVKPVLEIAGSDGIMSISAPAFIQFPSGASFENAIATIASGELGTSPAQFIQLLLASGTTTTAGARDQVQIELNSAAADGSSDANGELIWVGSNGTPHEYATWDSTGFNILAGLATASHPGSSPAVPETRQSATAGNGWSGTVFYELTGTGRVEIVAQLTAPASAVNNVTIVTLPAGYRPASGIQFGVQQNSGSNAGFGFTMTLGSDGTLKSNGVTASATVWVGPLQLPLDL